jgi:hypothetical protein
MALLHGSMDQNWKLKQIQQKNIANTGITPHSKHTSNQTATITGFTHSPSSNYKKKDKRTSRQHHHQATTTRMKLEKYR